MAKIELSEEKSTLIKMLIILVCLVLVAALSLLAVSGISYLKHKGDVLITDDEVKELFGELIPKAETVNRLIFGEGAAVSPDAEGPVATVTGAQYRRVADDTPYLTLDELRAAVSEVYSTDYIEKTIAPVAFDGVTDEEKTEVASSELEPRYKTAKDPTTGEEYLAVDITRKGFELKTVIDPSTAHVTGRVMERNGLIWRVARVEVTCACTVGDSERELTFGIVREADGWKLNDPTY